MNLAFNLTSVKDSLPATILLTSRTVLFIVDGKPHVGYYHDNGWFYCFEHDCGLSMAAASTLATNYSDIQGSLVTHWCYLRD